MYYYRTKKLFWQTDKNILDSTPVRHIMKTTKDKKPQLHIYCTEEVHAKAMELAEASDDRSMSYVLIKLIEKAHAELLKHNLKR